MYRPLQIWWILEACRQVKNTGRTCHNMSYPVLWTWVNGCQCISMVTMVGGFKHFFFHNIWIYIYTYGITLPPHWFSYFSRWLLHHQPVQVMVIDPFPKTQKTGPGREWRQCNMTMVHGLISRWISLDLGAQHDSLMTFYRCHRFVIDDLL